MKTTNEFDLDSLSVRDFKPDWGIVLGSGLGTFVDRLDVAHIIPFGEIEGLPVSKVPGHAGRFHFATIAGRRTVIAQGRVHLYEGHTAQQVAAGVRFMAALGISKLILTNAAGTLHPDYAPGSWMMIRDHINLTGTSPLLGGAHFFDMSEVYSERLRRHFAGVAAAENVPLHEGVYAAVTGPQYETPAEIHMIRGFGADAVGMSTVLEAIQARALGIELAGFSCLTNWAAGLGAKPLGHEEVIECASAAGVQLARLLEKSLALC